MARENFKAIAAVYVIMRRENQILMIRRQNTGYEDGNYSLPAGHHDGGETLIRAAAREAREEVGVEIVPSDLHLVHVMHKDSPEGERIGFFFEASRWIGEPQNAEPDKCDDVRWVTFGDWPQNMHGQVRDVLEAIGRGQTYSDYPITSKK